jgi:hypothetical protein
VEAHKSLKRTQRCDINLKEVRLQGRNRDRAERDDQARKRRQRYERE